MDYADKTSNYLSFNDFDGVEVTLEPDCKAIKPDMILYLHQTYGLLFYLSPSFV